MLRRKVQKGMEMAIESKAASAATAAANKSALARYAMDDVEDFETARRGLVAPLPAVTSTDGKVVHDVERFAFLEGDEPAPAIKVSGDAAAIDAYAAVVDDFSPDFAIVTP